MEFWNSISQWFVNTWNEIVLWFTSGAWKVWFGENVKPLLMTLFGLILTVLAKEVVSAVVKNLKTKIKNDEAKIVLDKINDIIQTRADETTQTFVSDLKKNNVFNADKQKEAMSITLANIGNDLSNALKKYIKSNFGNVEDWLKTKVEAYLHTEK